MFIVLGMSKVGGSIATKQGTFSGRKEERGRLIGDDIIVHIICHQWVVVRVLMMRIVLWWCRWCQRLDAAAAGSSNKANDLK